MPLKQPNSLILCVGSSLLLLGCSGDAGGADGLVLPETALAESHLLMAGMINNVPELGPGGFSASLGPIDVDLSVRSDKLELTYHFGPGYVSEASLATLTFNVRRTGDGIVLDPSIAATATTFFTDVIATQPELSVVGAPRVLRVQQAGSVIVIDTLWLVRVPDQPAEQADLEVEFRVSLMARSALPVATGDTPTRADAEAARFGINNVFGAAAETTPLQRIPIGPAFGDAPLSIYLKNFPAEYGRAGEQAVEAWNDALGYRALEPVVATDDIDTLDPRYFVLKWIDPGDRPGFSGLYASQNDWVTGVSVGGTMLFHGGVVEYRQNEHAYTTAVMTHLAGADPLIDSAVMSDPTVDAGTLVFDFAQSVIIHEIGHQLGLDHNFEGSWTEAGNFWSVMDYAPRNLRHRRLAPGDYDTAAALWTYYMSGVANDLPMCRSYEVDTSPTCSHSDIGDPIDYVLQNLPATLDLVERVPVEATEHLLSPVAKLMENAQKLICLADQLPTERRDDTVAAAQALLDRALYLVPDPNLTAAETEIVGANLAIVIADAESTVLVGCAMFQSAARRHQRGCMLPR